MIDHAYPARAVPVRQPRPFARRFGGSSGALTVAGLCLAALALVWALINDVSVVQWKDAAILHDFTLLETPPIARVGNSLLHLLEPLPFVLWGIALTAFALARARPRTAGAVALVMSLAPYTSETLKPILAHPHHAVDGVFIGAASWPSGHSTAALALALSVVLVAPARLRPAVAALGVLYALAVGCSLLILARHMPSDVLGGYLVATFWAALALAALRAAERRWPTRRGI